MIALAMIGLAASASVAAAGERAMVPPDEAASWTAVGRLNVAGNRYCTATLIAPRLALTAAHCLFNRQSGRRAPPEEIVFVAGARPGGHVAAVRAAATAITADIAPEEARAPTPADDLALVALSAAIGPETIMPLEVSEAAPASGAEVTLVGYGRDRPHAVSMTRGCRIIGVDAALLALDCGAPPGASGAPVLLDSDGRRTVVGVVSASTRRGAAATLAVRLGPSLSALRARLAVDD